MKRADSRFATVEYVSDALLRREAPLWNSCFWFSF